eukprot:92534_1
MTQSIKSYNFGIVTKLGYLEYIPSKTNKCIGGIVFLHGVEERGNDASILKRCGLCLLLEKKTLEIGFVVLSPQLPHNMWWKDDFGIQIIDKMFEIMTTKYNNIMDMNKIYLTGLSMGAYGVWKYASLYPNKFAAYAPICGGIMLKENTIKSLSNVPLWNFHGKNDKIVKVSWSDNIVNAINKYKRDKE